jgi:hypothetical protein
MSHEIAVLIPLRNPTEVLRRTIESLTAQTDREFSVLLSDNHSTTGLNFIEEARNALEQSGLKVELIQPPQELERVEHWNWMHTQSSAEWLKPLFAGDWLEPGCVTAIQVGISLHPFCRFLHTGYVFHSAKGSTIPVNDQCIGTYRSAEVMLDRVLRYGHQFGPPIAVAYERTAFLAAGGYQTALPICADSLLFCQLAVRFGVLGIPDLLGHFNLHGARFSTDLAARFKNIYREKLTYHAMLVYHAWTESRPIPLIGVLRVIAREIRSYRREAAQREQLA